MKRKHVVILTPYYAPAWSYGGPPRVLSTLAEELVKKGISVTVITTDSLGEQRTDVLEEERSGVRIHRFRSVSNQLCYKLKLFFIPGLLQKADSIFASADTVLISDVRSILSWQVFSHLVRRRIPYGVFLYGQVEHGQGWKAWIKKLFDYIWVRRYIQSAQWVFAQTDHEKKVAQEVLGAKPQRVYLSLLPIPSISTRNESHRVAFRKKYDIPINSQMLLFVGRLHYLKGVDLLIDAVVPLLEKKKQLILVIVGRDDGVERSLKKMVPPHVSDRIVFTGPLYEDDAKAAYAASDIFVFTPRFYEETSTAALEALSVGTPTVTTQQAETPYVEEYGAGLTIPNEKNAIQQAVVQILGKQKKQKSTIASNAKRLIREKYLASSVADQLLKDIKL